MDRFALPRLLLIGALTLVVGCGAGGNAPVAAPGPLVVTSVTPAHDATGAAWTETLRATFNRDVDPATVNATTFVVQQGAETAIGAVAYDAPSKTATFATQGAFRPDTLYTAKITTGVADTGGIHLESDYSWSFRTAVNTMQSLHTSGNQILAADGQPVVFRGVNAIDPAWLDRYYGHWDAEYFQKMADWHVRLVRFPVHNAPFQYYGAEAYLRLLDRGVALAAQHGIYSIIDYHGFGYPPTGEWHPAPWGPDPTWGDIWEFSVPDMTSFWQAVATHFSGDTRVAFYDLFNEPYYNSSHENSLQIWGDWRAFAEARIDEIRARDPGRCVIVGGMGWSHDLSLAPGDPVQRPNVVYAAHIYPWSMNTDGWAPDWDHAFGIPSQTIPVLVAEVGFDPNATDSGMRGTAEGFGIPIIDNYLEPGGIGWLAWVFGPEWAPPLLANWNYEPTVSGQFFRERLLAH